MIRSGSGLLAAVSLEMSRTSFTDGAFILTPDKPVDLFKQIRKECDFQIDLKQISESQGNNFKDISVPGFNDIIGPIGEILQKVHLRLFPQGSLSERRHSLDPDL